MIGEKQMIYVITTFEKVDRNAGYWIKYGSQRTVGYYFNYEDALEVLNGLFIRELKNEF